MNLLAPGSDAAFDALQIFKGLLIVQTFLDFQFRCGSFGSRQP